MNETDRKNDDASNESGSRVVVGHRVCLDVFGTVIRDAGASLRWLAFLFFGAALVFAGVAALLGDVFFFRLATESLIFGGLALSVDLLLGRTGLLPLGQALFFGFGAYVSALTLKHLAPSLPLALALVLISGTLVGLVGGLIAIRAKGVYFALISFGLAQVVSKIVFNTRELGASDGLIGVPAPVIHLGVASLDTAHAPSFFLLVLAGMALTNVSGFVWALNASRGWNHLAWLNIPLTLATQAVAAWMLPLNCVMGLAWFIIASSAVQCGHALATCIFGLTHDPRIQSAARIC